MLLSISFILHHRTRPFGGTFEAFRTRCKPKWTHNLSKAGFGKRPCSAVKMHHESAVYTFHSHVDKRVVE